MDLGDSDIKEGFLCPICHVDFRQPKILLTHFQEKHSEETDVLKSLKDLFGKAKNKILKVDEKDIETIKSDIKFQQYFLEKSDPQNPGVYRSHLSLFKEIRRERLDHRTSETNKLIIRLDKFLRAEGSDKKQVAQELVAWLDGTTVSRCPSCAASFNLTRRQHHCRLCGSIMCNSCSAFLSFEEARSLTTSVYTKDHPSSFKPKNDSETLRICTHCEGMLQSRKNLQMSQAIKPLICELFEELGRIKNEIQPNVDMYMKIFNSLDNGDSIFQIQDAQSLKVTIAKQAETMDAISKKIAALPVDPEDPQVLRLQNNIRRTASLFIKDNLLTLPPVPTATEIARNRERRLQQVEDDSPTSSFVMVQKVAVTTGWSTSNVPEAKAAGEDAQEDPLLEQINIVRNYIKQATDANRFEEVASLRANLNMLKEMHKEQLRRKR